MSTDLVKYTATDGQEVSLTFDTIRRFLVSGKGNLVTPQELVYFMGICKTRKLNPFAKDCYLIKYSENEAAAIVTSVDYFRKRARAQPDCRGWKRGVIVQKPDGTLRYSNGLVLNDEILLGGWFEAQPQGWDYPFSLEVNLTGYIKKTRNGDVTKFWQSENQPTMIMKIAESQGLRTLWPDEFQGIHTREEIPDFPRDAIDVTPERKALKDRPDFDAMLPQDIDRQQVERYVATCAQHFKQSEQEFKAAIVENNQIQDFLKAFRTWAKKQPGQTMDHGENGPQRGQELSEPPEKEENSDPWQVLRSEFLKLRYAGFSTWVFRNRDRLAQAPEGIRAEAREKWSKLYPANRWPLDVEGAPELQPALFESEQAPAVDFQTGEITEMVCPERDGKTVPVEDCDVCDMRDSCPSWRNDDE
jgi:phage recombination protein Bet